MCLSDGGHTVQFQARAIQHALHAHEKIRVPFALSGNIIVSK